VNNRKTPKWSQDDIEACTAERRSHAAQRRPLRHRLVSYIRGCRKWAYRAWLWPVSEARWMASSSLCRVTAVSKLGSIRRPDLMDSPNRRHICATLKGGP